MKLVNLCIIAVFVIACSDNKKANNPSSPSPLGAFCDANPTADGCGVACGAETSCLAGFYCGSEARCAADCSLVQTFPCAAGQLCTANGQCVDSNSPPGTGGDGGIDACATVDINAADVPPHVYVIVDQSTSMNKAFNGKNRWNTLRDLLIGVAAERPSGLLHELQSRVRFGFAMYSAKRTTGNPSMPIGACPMINNPNNPPPGDDNSQAPIASQLNNYSMIEDLYDDADMVGGTPTGETISFMTALLANNPPAEPGAKIFLLATDGEPDTCANGQAPLEPTRAEVVAKVQAAFTAQIRTFIIGISNDINAQHLQAVANAGVGVTAGMPDAPYYQANNATQLGAALEAIVRESRSCTLQLSGEIDNLSRRCEGTIKLVTEAEPQGRVLQCDGADGWEAVDSRNIKLLGTACEDFLQGTNVSVQGMFPCNVASLL